MQERTGRVAGSLARKEIGNLYHTILVEKFGLKDLDGWRSNPIGSEETEGTYVRGWEIALLGGEVYGWSDREVATLVLVKDASEDGGGVEIGNAIRVDLTDGWTRLEKRIGARWGRDTPEPSKLICERGLESEGQEKRRIAIVAH